MPPKKNIVKSFHKCLANTVLNLDMKFRRPSNNVNHNINFIQSIIVKYKYHTRIAANENYVNPFTKTTFCFSKKDLQRKSRKRNKKVKNPEKSCKSNGIPMKLIMEGIDLFFPIMNEGFSFCPQNGTLFTYFNISMRISDSLIVCL